MAEQKVVVVTEVAPRLKEFDSSPAMSFLREYVSYENRVEGIEAKIPMRCCLEPEDLESLLQCSEDMVVELVNANDLTKKNSVPARSNLRTPLHEESPLAPTKLIESDKGERKEGEPEPVERVVRLSNAHIELMLIHVLGPHDPMEATCILRGIRMSRDEPFLKLATATSYVQEWKIAMRWCRNYLPREKTLVKSFTDKVVPKKLGQALESMDIKSIEKIMKIFLDEYRVRVNARRVLANMDMVPVCNDSLSKQKAMGANSTPVAKSTSPAAVKSSGGAPTAQVPKSNDKNVKRDSDSSSSNWTKSVTCHNCGQHGHIRPECPQLQQTAKGGNPSMKKLGTLLKMNQEVIGPYLAVDLFGVDSTPSIAPKSQMRLMACADSGAEIDVISSKWLPLLELHGGIVRSLDVPVNIEWLDGKAKNTITQAIDMQIQIVECNKKFQVTLLVVPWQLDNVVLGWETLTTHGILKNLDDFMAIQKSLGVSVGMVKDNDNMVVNDMDGQDVTCDSLRWEEESEAPPIISSVLGPNQQREIDELVDKYSDVFNELPAGSALVEPMIIKLKPGWQRPPMESYRRYSPRVQEAIDFELHKQLETGVVEESQASVGCPVEVVPKIDSESGYRFCINYKSINEGVEVEPYPLPNISTILSSLAGAEFFAKLDLKSGYWQFPVREDCRDFLSFFVRGRMYQYRVVPMGFVQSSFHVQRVMYTLFAKYFGNGVFVYLDDIIIYAVNWDEFLKLCNAVLSILCNAKLVCKRAKCSFGLPSLEILGHLVSKDGVQMSERRKEAILAIPFPRSARDLRRFLGMANYMRAYIPRYSILARPLSGQVNASVSDWPVAVMKQSFEELKTAIANQLSLGHLDYAVPLVIKADASIIGLGACLVNRYPNGDRVIGCCSHAFNETEARWKTIEQEAFAIIFAVLYFRAVLWGHPFLIETDHRNLTFIHSGTSAKVVRWSLLLQSMSYAISFTPGEENYLADELSRNPICNKLVGIVRLSDFEPATVRLRRLSLRAVGDVIVDDVSVETAMAWFAEQHNDTVGHRGIHAVLRTLQELGRIWPRMSRDVTSWIAACPECQKFRLAATPVVSIPSPIASFQIFEEIGIDYIGPLPKDQLNNTCICNIVCMTTHYCELFAVEAETAVIAAHCLLSVVARYGCFRSLRSDRGTHFVNEVISEFLRLFEIRQVLTLAERPQANAIVERNGGEVMRHLRVMVAARDLRPIWSVVLPLVQRIINNTWKGAINNTPHRLIHWAPTDLDRGLFAPFREAAVSPPLQSEYVAQLQVAYERLLDETSEFVCMEQKKLQSQYVGIQPTEFAVGNYVLLSYLVRPPSKLSARWAGPYRIVTKNGNNVLLEDLTGGPSKTVDVSRLKHFIVGKDVDVRAVAAADLGEVEVQVILSHRGTARDRKNLEFEVQWLDGDVTWEPWERVRKLTAVDEYIRDHPRSGLKSLMSI